MAGYCGHKMSNNAVDAYHRGLKPRSRWTKENILDELPDNLKSVAKQCTIEALREYFLQYDEWHHTGKYFSSTSFFSIDEFSINNFDETELLKLDEEYRACLKAKRKAKATETFRLAYCEWGEWVGSRNHPKLVEHRGYCVLKGTWAYTEEKTKKKVSGSHFEIIEEYSKAPYGKAKVFAEIKKHFSL